VHSTYVYLLKQVEQRDQITWGVHQGCSEKEKGCKIDNVDLQTPLFMIDLRLENNYF
jgi:hypothetical protein